ncbi:type II secretion system protein, partial [Pseudomonas asplenii]
MKTSASFRQHGFTLIEIMVV